MPRLYREAPLNSIWEGSGNVIGLDVLRVVSREPEVVSVFMAEVAKARGSDANLDRIIDDLHGELNNPDDMEVRMRMITEMMALALQGALLTQNAPAAVAEAFRASRPVIVAPLAHCPVDAIWIRLSIAPWRADSAWIRPQV